MFVFSILPFFLFSFLHMTQSRFPQVRCVASTHVGDLVSASRDCSARVWSGSDGKVNQSSSIQLIGHEKFCISCCAIPPCARFPAGAVASCSQDSSIIIWDNGEPAFTLLGHNEQVPYFLFIKLINKKALMPAIPGQQHLCCSVGRGSRVDQLRQRPLHQGTFVFSARNFVSCILCYSLRYGIYLLERC
jgi:hypothetical protein